MEGVEKAEKSENESPPLRIDPKCLQDALRPLFQPIGTNDPRLAFYTQYKKEVAEYDVDYIKKYDEDLNTTLIFAGLFSAVSSAFVVDVHSKLQSDPNDQSVAFLRAILLTLNQSAIPGEALAPPPVQQDPPSEIVTVTSLMYASLLISLLAAFFAMLGKQWINRYLRNASGSVIERCRDRQRKCDGLEKWPFHLFVEGLPVMLQVALLLLASALCRYMWSINTAVAYTLITLTGLGVLSYLGIVVAGMVSYACPFQTPPSTILRSSWKELRPVIASLAVRYRLALSRARRVWGRRVRLLRSQSLPMIRLENIRVQQPEPWLYLEDPATIRITNANDVQCVSWILRNITNPETFDAAIQLAGLIWWYGDEADSEPPYDVISSAYRACFDSDGEVYPGSRDRAYYSGQAMLWIRTCAARRSEELAYRFPIPETNYTTPAHDHDLTQIITINGFLSPASRLVDMFNIDPRHTPSHSRWISNVLLHHSWAYRADQRLAPARWRISSTGKTAIPLGVILNRLLAWSICLGSSVEEEALKVQNKSYHLERILRLLSEAIVLTASTADHRLGFIPHALRDMIKLEARPEWLTTMAYEWCSAICENQGFEDWENALLDSLEIGFRHLNPSALWYGGLRLTHTEHHRGLVDVVFGSGNSEAIADLLQAWTTQSESDRLAHTLLSTCVGHLADLPNLAPFSSRLRQLLVRSVGLIGYKGFQEVGVERFVELLNHLRIGVEDAKWNHELISLLLDTIQSPEGLQYFSIQSWESLVEIVIVYSEEAEYVAYGPQVMASLLEAEEWDKLEYWIAVVWMIWPPATEETTEDLKRGMVSLFRRQPDAVQKLTQWMERWSAGHRNDRGVAESFERICKQVHEAAQ